MFAKALGVSEAELLRELAFRLYGDPNRQIEPIDALAAAVTSLQRVYELEQRFNAYDAAGPGEWVTMNEACRLAGRSRATLYRHIKIGLIKSKRIEGRRFVERDSLFDIMHLDDTL